MRHCVLPVIFWALISLPALAQKAEVFGGYQYAHFDGGPNANGWNGSATYNITSFLGATADVSGAYGSGLRVHTYTFGPTLSAGKGSISPFVHALFGGFHTTVSGDRKSTRLNSSHQIISYAVFCLKKKTKTKS